MKVNLTNFDLVMESDLGTFAPVALQFAGSAAAQKVGLVFFHSLFLLGKPVFIHIFKCLNLAEEPWLLNQAQEKCSATFLSDPNQQVMQEVVKLLAPLNTTKLEGYAEGTDISMWMRAGVPGEATFSQ